MATTSAHHEHAQSRDNSRMHNGNNYNYTTNNTGFFHVPKKPPGDPIHADLIRACAERARTPRLHYLLSQGANVDHKDGMECTPLHHAVFGGSMETISAIVQAGGDVNAATSQFGTPLCLAAMRRDLAAVTFLIEHNASVNKKCTMLGSAAHAACAGGDLAVIRALHAAGADWKSPHSVFVSALCHLSRLAQEGDVPLACGSLEYPEYQLQSAGAVAVRFRHCEAVEFCLRLPKGPSVLEVWQFISSSSATYVLGFSYQTRFVGNTMSLLSLAMSTLDIRTAKSLLNHGACDNILDPLGRGALAYALDATRLQGTNAADLDSAVKLLVRHGVDINGLHSPNWQYRHAAKDLLDNWERYYASGELLQCPAVNVYDPLEQAGTALMYTVSRGNKLGSRAHCIEVLLNNGAKIDVRDKKGTSALDLARICLYGEQRIEVERILLRHGTSFAGHNDVRNTWDYY